MSSPCCKCAPVQPWGEVGVKRFPLPPPPRAVPETPAPSAAESPHTLQAEKPEAALARGPSLTTLAGSPPPICLVFCVPSSYSSVLGLVASDLGGGTGPIRDWCPGPGREGKQGSMSEGSAPPTTPLARLRASSLPTHPCFLYRLLPLHTSELIYAV